jgi:DNA-directed RNA polymerase subunit alpha
MDITIYDMDFSVRTYACLRRSKINTKQELEQWTKEELLTLRNMHVRQLDEILERKDVKLKETL